MGLLSRLLHPAKRGDEQAADRVRQLVVNVLQDQRFLGELLMQLPRQFNAGQPVAVKLTWDDNQLVLAINPQRLLALRQDEAESLLEHEALHVAWRHPFRYARHPRPGMVRVATDVAVNQYLPEPPAGTATIAQLEKILRRKVPPRLDSQDYLRMLEKTTIAEREKLRHAGIDLEQHHHQGRLGKKGPQLETHQGWQQAAGEAGSSQQIRLANLQKVITQAWRQTPQRDRGLLPGNIEQELRAAVPERRRNIKWSAILRQQLGLIAAGKKPSHARFNRRQPLRMDLPGQVTRLAAQVLVFVDNSGSMADDEIVEALAEVERISKEYRLPVKTYSFDAKVYPDYHPERKGRRGGGGTRFQSIFDYLHTRHLPRSGTVVIIMTDGWGEKNIRDYHYRNVYWLLTTTRDQLSVPAHANRVLEIKKGKVQ